MQHDRRTPPRTQNQQKDIAMTATLYAQNQPAFDALAQQGFPAICEMAKLFHRAHEIDRELGYENAASRWARGGKPGAASERKCKEWLASRHERPPVPEVQAAAGGVLFLGSCTKETFAKAQRVLTILGCEVVEV